MEVTISSIVERWSGLERPLFKGKLIDAAGCKCAQGDVLSCAGYSNKQLRDMEQPKADLETARILGISVTHSILLRLVNDSQDGCPQLVLKNPEQIIGDKAPLLLAFWLHLDSVLEDAWEAARAVAGAAVGAPVWDDTRGAAGASSEIHEMDLLEKQGRQPCFLALFGFDTWDKVRKLNGGSQ